jgi:hypothetical protein
MVQSAGEIEHFQVDKFDALIPCLLSYLSESILRHGYPLDDPPHGRSYC